MMSCISLLSVVLLASRLGLVAGEGAADGGLLRPEHNSEGGAANLAAAAGGAHLPLHISPEAIAVLSTSGLSLGADSALTGAGNRRLRGSALHHAPPPHGKLLSAWALFSRLKTHTGTAVLQQAEAADRRLNAHANTQFASMINQDTPAKLAKQPLERWPAHYIAGHGGDGSAATRATSEPVLCIERVVQSAASSSSSGTDGGGDVSSSPHSASSHSPTSTTTTSSYILLRTKAGADDAACVPIQQSALAPSSSSASAGGAAPAGDSDVDAAAALAAGLLALEDANEGAQFIKEARQQQQRQEQGQGRHAGKHTRPKLQHQRQQLHASAAHRFKAGQRPPHQLPPPPSSAESKDDVDPLIPPSQAARQLPASAASAAAEGTDGGGALGLRLSTQQAMALIRDEDPRWR